MKAIDPFVLARVQGFPLRVKMVVDGVLSGLHRSRHKGANVEFAEHKEYSPGDDIRYIDWRAYARRDKYSIKQYEEESRVRSFFLVDQSASMSYRGGYESSDKGLTKFEYAQILAGSLAYLLLHQRDAVGVIGLGGDLNNLLPARSTLEHFHKVITQLENLSPAFKGKWMDQAIAPLAQKIKEGSLVMLFSDLLEPSEKILGFLRALRSQRHELVVFQILDRWEVEFPFNELTQFEDLESDNKVLVDGRSIRKQFCEEMGKFLESTRVECLREQIHYEMAITDQPPDEILINFLGNYTKSGLI